MNIWTKILIRNFLLPVSLFQNSAHLSKFHPHMLSIILFSDESLHRYGAAALIFKKLQ